MNYFIKEVDSSDTYDFLLNKHYAGRIPSISFAFGLFNNKEMVGVLTIGKPASNSLCVGACGKEFSKYVYELNRLCVIENLPKNTLSFFVSGCIKKLKKQNIILVSYSDLGMGHNGYIYQATNFIYTGQTKERTDKYTINGKHSRHYTNEYNHLRKFRTPKKRYIYMIGKMKKIFLENLKYKILPYEKGDNDRYILGDKQKIKVKNTLTGEIYYE